jgi:hypothetical protein
MNSSLNFSALIFICRQYRSYCCWNPLERNKERIFIYPFHAINSRRYDSSLYIIHTVEYFVNPRGKVYRYSTSWRGARAPNQRICVLVAMLGIFLRKGKGRPGNQRVPEVV